MTSPVPTLADFLLARLVEDEAVALAVLRSVAEVATPLEDWEAYPDGRLYIGQAVSIGLKPELAAYIARHDPARVLADVEAKRAVVRYFEKAEGLIATHPDYAHYAIAYDQALRVLAKPYAGADGWDEAWA